MQKKIIALAVAGLVSGVALAQTNVTIYGIADADYTYSKSDTGLAAGGKYKFSGIRDGVDNGLNGSRIGFKGEEALGNGLKAIFLIELRVNVPTGDQTQPTRQSYLGLNSAAAGSFLIGRQYSAAGDIYGNFSSNSVTTVNPVNSFQGVGGSQIVSGGGNSRQSNALKWVSPNWSGFTGRLSYAFSNNTRTTSALYDPKAETTDNGRWAVSGDYANGPLELGVILAKTSSLRTAAVAPVDLEGSDINEWFVGGSYDFKVVKLFATYQKMTSNNDGPVTLVSGSKLWQVGAGIPIGNGKINVEYAKVDFKEGNWPVPATRFDGGNKGWGVGYEYYFSKRTTAYGYVSQLKYDSNTAQVAGLPVVGGGANLGTAAVGEKQTNLSVGLRHVF